MSRRHYSDSSGYFRVKTVVRGKINRRIPASYKTHYYCGYCIKWILQDKALKDGDGRYICPNCANHLRTFKMTQEEVKLFERIHPYKG